MLPRCAPLVAEAVMLAVGVSAADVSVGTTITVSGTTATDGSVTASAVMIGGLPGFGGFRGEGGQAPATSQ